MVISPGGFAVMAMMPVVGILVGRTDARWLIAFGLGRHGASAVHHDALRYHRRLRHRRVGAHLPVGRPRLPCSFPSTPIAFPGLAARQEQRCLGHHQHDAQSGQGASASPSPPRCWRAASRSTRTCWSAMSRPGAARTTPPSRRCRRPTSPARAMLSTFPPGRRAQLYAMVQRQALMLSYIDAFLLLAVDLHRAGAAGLPAEEAGLCIRRPAGALRRCPGANPLSKNAESPDTASGPTDRQASTPWRH